MNEIIREARDERANAVLHGRLTWPSVVVLALAVACQKGGAPPPEPNQAPAVTASTEPVPAPPADTASAPAQASSAATPEMPPAPAPSSAPESTGAAATASAAPGKTTAASHAAAPPPPAASATPASADSNPVADACTTKNFHYTLIGNACHTGGRKAAKEIMKGAVKKAKAAGTDLKCTSCHEDTSTFHLKSNAVSDLKQWL